MGCLRYSVQHYPHPPPPNPILHGIEMVMHLMWRLKWVISAGCGGWGCSLIFLPLGNKDQWSQSGQGRRGQEQGLCLLRFQATGLCMVMRFLDNLVSQSIRQRLGAHIPGVKNQHLLVYFAFYPNKSFWCTSRWLDTETAAGSGFNMTTSRHTHLVLKSFSGSCCALSFPLFFKCFWGKVQSLPGKLWHPPGNKLQNSVWAVLKGEGTCHLH